MSPIRQLPIEAGSTHEGERDRHGCVASATHLFAVICVHHSAFHSFGATIAAIVVTFFVVIAVVARTVALVGRLFTGVFTLIIRV